MLVQSLVVSSAGAVGPLLFALVLCRMVFCSSLLVVLVADVLVFGVLLLLDGCSLLLLERCFLLLLGVCSLLLQEGRSLVAWYILLRRMRRLCPLWCCKRRVWLPCHWYKCLRWVCRRSIVSIVDWYILRRKFEIVSPLVLCAVYLATLLFVPD